MKRSTVNRISYSIVLAALLLSAVAPASVAPAATPVPSPAPLPAAPLPQAPPAEPPEPAPPAAPASAAPAAPPAQVEEAGQVSPAKPASPGSVPCANPPPQDIIPMGQDLELILGPFNNTTTRQITQTRNLVQPYAMSYLGPHTTATSNACTSNGPKPEEVYFYENNNYGGWCTVLTPGQYPRAIVDFPIRYIGNNMQSLRVGKNVVVTAWRYEQYTGSSRTFYSGEQLDHLGPEIPTDPCWATLCNNQANSAKVWVRPEVTGTVSAAALGTDSNIVLMKSVGGTLNAPTVELASMTWDAHNGWSSIVHHPITTTAGGSTLIPYGNPVVAVLLRDPIFFVRTGPTTSQNQLAFNVAKSTWSYLPDSSTSSGVITNAYSDPAVVVPDINHVKVFYRDVPTTTNGSIFMSQWDSNVGWSRTPINLGKPSGTYFVSEVNAVTRDENHVAVFAIGNDQALYVKEWSSLYKPDWSDTTWVQLMTGINKAQKPAVTSRHAGNVVVMALGATAVGGGYQPYYREWNAASYTDNVGTPRGWNTVQTPGGGLTSVGLVATGVDEMWAYGVSSANRVFVNKWTECSAANCFAGWSPGLGMNYMGLWSSGQVVAAVAGRPYDVMWYGRNTSNKVEVAQMTNVGAALNVTTEANYSWGMPRAQVIATVNARTVWVSLYRNGATNWYIDAKDTDAWTGTRRTATTTELPPTSTDTNKVSVAAGDVDQDGDDEVVVSTLDEAGHKITTRVYELTVSGSSVTAITEIANDIADYGAGVTLSDVNVDVGDLDGDGKKNEIAIAANRPGYAQVKIRVEQYLTTTTTLVDLADAAPDMTWQLDDVEMSVARVDDAGYEHIVVAAWTSDVGVGQIRAFALDRANATVTLAHAVDLGTYTGATGAYSTALATGDVDSDGMEEAVYSYATIIRAQSLESASNSTDPIDDMSGPVYGVSANDAGRSLAVGDADGDGRAEIVYNAGSTGWTGLLKLMDPSNATGLHVVGQASATPGVPLLADLDNDSFVATYVPNSCQEAWDARVVGVANSQPMYFKSDGGGWQDTGGGMAKGTGVITATEDGWSTSYGASLEIGLKQSWNTPILAIKLGEIRASVTEEALWKFGGGTEREHSTSAADGFEYSPPWEVPEHRTSHGAVCYSNTKYRCMAYSLVRANSTYTNPVKTCVPVIGAGSANLTCVSIEDWYSTDPAIGIRDALGGSWVPVGHHPVGQPDTVSYDLNVANNYPVAPSRFGLPAGLNRDLIWWRRTSPTDIGATSTGGCQTWEVEKTNSESSITSGGFEENTKVSFGADVFVFTFDASFTRGSGTEWSSKVGWEDKLSFSGRFCPYAAACPSSTCRPYSVVPYVYHATARTLAGATYSYLEQDYYRVPLALASEAAAQEAPAAVGLTPQEPVITSPTHPNPDTWYPADTVTFNWAQPPGDPARVIGYRWMLDELPLGSPGAMEVLTTTQTYRNVPDGVYYLHVLAVGDTGEYSPIAHRAFRVDMGAPKVAFAPIPSQPDGMNGWYNTPITFAVTATDLNGSGVKSIETSSDGTTWLSYTPLYVAADTPGRTLWARATDNLGHVSDIVSTTFKLDQTPPSVRDSDRYGLSYARIITDEVGNAQLVLGGALSDTLSGRLQVEVKAGETGEWNAISAVGDLPMPPGNWFTDTTMTSLQWMYTPTFEIRGAYPLYVRGVDMAGNYGHYYSNTLIMPGGCFWWDPVDVPALDESRVSVSPHQAKPGDVVAFTVAARDSGYQEAQYLITDTVPAGLTVLPGSITDGGQYDAATRQIVWTLHAAWPGQTRYLFFKATVDSATTTAALENQLDLMAYWPWDRTCDSRVPPEPARHYYSSTTTLTVLPGAAMRASAAAATSSPTAPQIINAAVVEGDIVGDPDVTLLVNASPEARYLYVREWVWNGALATWSQAHESGWVPFEAATGFVVSQDNIGKYGRYDWTLSEGDGIKYLGLWVADADGQTSNLNEGNLIHTNLLSAGGQQLAAGGRVQYRAQMRADQLAVLTLVSLSGDADLYVWKPRAGLKPHYYSNAVPGAGGLGADSVAFYAPEEGLYVIEVEAATDANYRLVTAGDIASMGLLAQAQDEALPASTHLSLADKERPAHPLTLTTPFSAGGSEELPATPAVPYRYYFPIVYK